jgi:hypothetical protein
MIYVFTFLGEFGYELLNWQGVVRKFAATLGPSDVVVCCSRARVYPLYEHADLYLDISDAPLFKRSRACCYSATIGAGAPGRGVNRAFDAALRASLRSFVTSRIRRLKPLWMASGDRQLVFVFSSKKTIVRGFAFGCDPDRIEAEADIGEGLDIEHNSYARIVPDLTVRPEVERRAGFDLSEPYMLVQTRQRRVGPASAPVPAAHVIRALSPQMRVVRLSFETGRWLDSFSRFDGDEGCVDYAARSFPEQACLIHHAARCVFLTEGDFGSHTYVPPFMGKDVVAVAPRSVYAPWRDAIDFWNRKVFRFGGQLIPHVAEELLEGTSRVA